MDENKEVVGRVLDNLKAELPEISGVVTSSRKNQISFVGSCYLNFVETLYGNLIGDGSSKWYSGPDNPQMSNELELGQGVLTISDLQWKRKRDMPYFDCSVFEYERNGKRMNFHGYVDSRWYPDRINLSFNSRRSRVRSIYDLDDQASTFVIDRSENIVAAFNQTLADRMFKLQNKYIVSEKGQYQVKHI